VIPIARVSSSVGDVGLILWEALKSLHIAYLNSKGTDVAVRCPYCGDSSKSSKSAHCYISLTEPLRYYCQRCLASGLLKASTLRDLQIYDDKVQAAVHLTQRASRYSRNLVTDGEQVGPSIRRSGLILPPPGECETEDECLTYVNDRLGTTITHSEAVRDYRMVYGIGRLLALNNLPWREGDREIGLGELTRKNALFWKLEEHCVGFATQDRMTVIYRSRNIEKTGFRYHAHNIFGEEDAGKVYSVRSDVDVMVERLTVIMTEGVLDLIGVHKHLYGGDSGGRAFLAATGKGFNLALLGLLRMGFVEMDVHVYSDNDVGIPFYRSLFGKNERLSHLRYYIHYNEITGSDGKSDWGVPSDQIHDQWNELRL
jgi:hypothetical protein